MANDIVSTSKFLSLVLRHDPGRIGIELDAQGWVAIDTLLRQCAAHRKPISRELLNRIVQENDKKRFAISPDGLQIRASQGHSVEVDLALDPIHPPEFLYHGTAERNAASIQQTGLNRAARQHVHLSLDRATATKVGQRHGKPIIFIVKAADMHRAGHQFFLSANGVWLTDSVPPEFLTLE